MPDNRFSSSVDEILEGLKQRQAAAPANDREVDEILADLGLGDGLPRPAAKPAPAKAQVEKAAPAPAKAATPTPVEKAAPAPAKAAAEKAAPAPSRQLKRPAEDPVVRQVRETVEEGPAAPPFAFGAGTVSETMQFDADFQKFFSERVAVIPDEEPEQHPGFFARFLRHKDDDAGFEEDEDLEPTGTVRVDEPTLMIPPAAAAPEEEPVALPVSEPTRPAAPKQAGPAPQKGDTGVIRLEAEDQAATREVGELSGDTGSIRFEQQPAEEEAPEEPARRGFLPRLFGGREEPADAPFEEASAPEYIDDYEDPADADAVRQELAGMRRRLGLRAAVSAVAALALLYLGLATGGGLLPPVGPVDPALAPAAYLAAQLILLAAVCAVNWRVFASGIPGIWAAPSADTIPALAAVGAALQLVVQLAGAEKFDAEKLTLFAAPAALLLCLNALGRFVMQGVVVRNFQSASAPGVHTAALLLEDEELAARLTQGLGEPAPCVLVNRPAELVKGFLRHSFSRRPSDSLAQKLGWLLAGGGLVAALICLFTAQGPAAAVTALAGALCLGAPLAATLLSAIPALLAQKSAAQVGAVVPGADAAAQLGRANVALVGAKDLVPGASVRLHGIKTFEKQRIDLAILYAASVLIEGCDTMRDVFMKIIQGKTEMLFPVENLENLPGYGFTAWVNNNRVILGTRAFMQQQGLEIPSLDYEQRYTKGKRLPVYLAVSGRLFAMFLVSYKANPQVAQALDDLRRQGVSLLVQSDDFDLTGEGLAALYGLPAGSVKVLTGAERRLLAPVTAPARDSEGCMIHLGSLASFTGGLRAAAGAAWGERVASLVQAAGVAVSCLLALVMAFTGGIGALGLPALLLYQAAWAVLTLCMPLLKKY